MCQTHWNPGRTLRKDGRLTLHFVRENLVLDQESNSADLLRWDMGVMFARGYVLQLSDNVKRSNREKVKKGEWIKKGPLGYVNSRSEDGGKTIVVDKERAPFITLAFELYGTGNHSMQSVSVALRKRGFLSRGGLPVPKSTIHRILTNPFYYGDMAYKGDNYPHRYPTLITKEQFDACQAVRKERETKPVPVKATNYIFRGLVECSQCGCTISPEIKKGRYIYYACTNYHRTCKRRYVREEIFVPQAEQLLAGLRAPESQIDAVIEELKKDGGEHRSGRQSRREAHQKQLRRVKQRESRLVDDYYDKRITEAMYEQKREEYQRRRERLESELFRSDNEGLVPVYLTAEKALMVGRDALDTFQSSEVPQKHAILDSVLQNCWLTGTQLQFEPHSVFQAVSLTASRSSLLPALNAFRRLRGEDQRRLDN